MKILRHSYLLRLKNHLYIESIYIIQRTLDFDQISQIASFELHIALHKLSFRIPCKKTQNFNSEAKFDQILHCVLATGSGDLFLRMDLGALGQDLRLICGLSGLFLLSSIVAFYI